MSGSIMTVAVPVVDPIHSSSQSTSHSQSAFFHRSHSTSDLLSGTPRRFTPIADPTTPSHIRSLSVQSLPNSSLFDLPSFDFEPDLSTRLSLSTDDLNPGFGTNEKSTIVRSEKIPSGLEQRAEKMGKGRSLLSRSQLRTPTSKSPAVEKGGGDHGEGEMEKEKGPGTDQEAGRSKFLEPSSRGKTKAVADSLTSLARRSWMTTSRSPSPGNRTEESDDVLDVPPLGRERSNSASLASSLTRRMSLRWPAPVVDSEEGKATDPRGKFGNYLTKIKQRPQVALAKGRAANSGESTASSTTSLAPPSTDTRFSHASERSSNTAPDDVAAALKMPKARDPLWSIFKNLESEYSKFQAKSAPTRMTLVRIVLLPFLRNYASHVSNKRLSPEDLERRAVILNKWWGGLLEMLNGKAEFSVAGVDRPTLIEVVTLIMMRPEWRQSTTSFTPLSNRRPRDRPKTRPRVDTNASCSGGSVDSTDSEYFAESAEHNVRTMFVNNLITQMAIAVDKLSLRHAPLVLVNFAGKTCAYAFFFAPGIADVLVRIWALKPDSIRRVADEFGLPKMSQSGDSDVTALFPPNLARLGWSSLRAMSSTLRQTPTLPLTAARINWHGPWVSRWRGRETDLFFIFCKYYYMLAEEFMPSELPLAQKARAPGFVLVNAQILSVLDSTIHRQAAAEANLGLSLADASPGNDAMAMPLPVAANALKGMSDNRLIVLLKDILSSASIGLSNARHTFAESFMSIMKASAKRTSQFDHNACFVLCDFLEEALQAFDNFVDLQRPDLNYIDWSFWLEAWKKVMESHHTMSEIRILSLLFSLWDVISSDPARKEHFCMGWLLTPETFNKFFTNWCPMVRAYYMRLLCWRICRDAGNANDSDTKIYLLVSSRLRTTWSHYLWLKQDAEKQGRFPPSTAPSYPAPGKRFMIIRTEASASQPGLVVGFDHFTNTISEPELSDPTGIYDTLESPSSEAKKKWGLLGKVFSFTGNSTSANDLETIRRETAMTRSRPVPPPKSPVTAVTPPASDSDSMGSSTYETLQYIFKFILSYNAYGTMAPPNRILTRPRLPGPAQSCVNSKDINGAPPQPAAGRPPATRAFSGSSHAGLVDSARNADPADVSPTSRRISMSFDHGDSLDFLSPMERTSFDEQPSTNNVTPTQEPITQPVQPTGIYASTVKYAGRALAEWGLVVGECNGFIDRRRDEGVLGLSEVEVPTLSVEGIRKLG